MLRNDVIEVIEYFKHQRFRVKLASGDLEELFNDIENKNGIL